jgi:hypothetical protein
MSLRGSGLDPEFESLVRPPRITRRAPSDLRARALAHARAVVAARGVLPPAPPKEPATLVSIPPPPRRARRPLRVAFAAAVGVVAVTVGAIAALRGRVADPACVSTAVSLAAVPVGRAEEVASEPSTESRLQRPEPARKASSASSRRSGVAEGRFTAELQLLQRAQVTYTRREFSSALALIGEHARRFPRGHLAEEREALRVRCLRGAGRSEEAHRAASGFAVRFPRSVLLPRVDSAEND